MSSFDAADREEAGPRSNPSPAKRGLTPLARPRVAIVGCGLVGDLHRERLLEEPVDIVAICDPDANALSRMAARLPRRPRLFRSETDLLAAGVADAVVLCTPHGHHAAQCRASLEAGVHVLCEKPFVTHLGEAKELVHLAEERNLALYVAYTRRSRGHANFLRQAARRIGPLTNIQILRSQSWLQAHRRTWRMHEAEGGGFLLDAGASMLDLMLRLTGSTVDEIEARLMRPSGVQLDVDVRAFVRLTFLNGTRVGMVLLGDATENIEQIQLFGEKGTAGWRLRQDTPHDLYVRVADGEGAGGGETETGDPARYRTVSPDTAWVAALRGSDPGDAVAAQGAELYGAATAVPVVELVERVYREAVWQ